MFRAGVRPSFTAVATSSTVASAWVAAAAQMRRVNVNPQAQQRRSQEFQNAPKMTQYDIDKEKWGKQTMWHTMDCVLDPNIEIPKKLSWKGVKKMISMFITQRKLKERRPGFDPAVELRAVFLEYLRVANSPSGNQQRDLCRVTTWTEAVRIENETRKIQVESEEREALRLGKPVSKSWKDMAVKSTSAGAVTGKKTAAPAATGPSTPIMTAKSDAPKQAEAAAAGGSDPAAASSSSAAGKSAADEIVPDLKTPLLEIRLDSFDIINFYIGQMTNDDWVQITAKVTGKWRTHKTAPLYESFTEYPVFETKMGDGINTANTAPFRVVAVMDKHGSRYGKDGNDAGMLRKSLSQSKQSWFGLT